MDRTSAGQFSATSAPKRRKRDCMSAVPPPDAGRSVSTAEALRFWLKLGFISFGGPAGQIAIMHRELVQRRRWLSEERFFHALNYCMLLPGPEAQQLATYIGWLMHKTAGGIAAGGLFVLPSIFVLLGLSYAYCAYGGVPTVALVLATLKPVVVAIVLDAMLKIAGRALKRRAHFALAFAAFTAMFLFSVPFPLIVAVAGVLGWIGALYWPDVFTSAMTRQIPRLDQDTAGDAPPTVIDDHTPPPAHTLPARARLIRIAAAGFVLWVLPFVAVVAFRGWSSLHAQEYGFFTRAALVTFGGAYAVLAYVTQATTGPEGWLTKTQAVDGLALAETTPGPLIMVLQFVGFVAAWNRPEGMTAPVSAVMGALLTTWATFLPSFLFIFAGAPYVEVLRGNLRLTGVLTGITAAVVGVVLNLALVFGTAVIWPAGFVSAPDWIALLLSLAAFAALYRFKLDVLWLVAAAAILGSIRGLAG
jgi:chromate transporter